jgi:glutathione S-transferase
MLRVLGRSTSINVRKVLWLCAELDLLIDHEEWSDGERSNRSDEFKQWNPNGLVPVINDGDFVLWESNAICRYLAAQHGREDLLPIDLRQRALVEQWMDWQTTQLNNSWRYAFFALVRKAATHRTLKPSKQALPTGVAICVSSRRNCSALERTSRVPSSR